MAGKKLAALKKNCARVDELRTSAATSKSDKIATPERHAYGECLKTLASHCGSDERPSRTKTFRSNAAYCKNIIGIYDTGVSAQAPKLTV
jgi:hypothetical protein